MHESMCERAIGGEKQQAGRAHVEPSDRNPASVPGRGQMIEDRGPALGILPGGHLARRLVIKEYLDGRLRQGKLQPAAIQPDIVTRFGHFPELCRVPVAGDASGTDPPLDGAPRAVTARRQELVQSRRHERLISGNGRGVGD